MVPRLYDISAVCNTDMKYEAKWFRSFQKSVIGTLQVVASHQYKNLNLDKITELFSYTLRKLDGRCYTVIIIAQDRTTMRGDCSCGQVRTRSWLDNASCFDWQLIAVRFSPITYFKSDVGRRTAKHFSLFAGWNYSTISIVHCVNKTHWYYVLVYDRITGRSPEKEMSSHLWKTSSPHHISPSHGFNSSSDPIKSRWN